MKNSALIDRICIRAKDNFGKWGSFTLGELLEMKKDEKLIDTLATGLYQVLKDNDFLK